MIKSRKPAGVRLAGFTLALLFIISCCSGGPEAERVVLENLSSNRVIFSEDLSKVLRVYFIYEHSYDKDTVEETFKIERGMLVPIAMVFSSDTYDYHDTRYRNSLVSFIDNQVKVEISGEEGYRSIKYRIGYTISQEFKIETISGSRDFLLSNYGAGGELISLSIK